MAASLKFRGSLQDKIREHPQKHCTSEKRKPPVSSGCKFVLYEEAAGDREGGSKTAHGQLRLPKDTDLSPGPWALLSLPRRPVCVNLTPTLMVSLFLDCYMTPSVQQVNKHPLSSGDKELNNVPEPTYPRQAYYCIILISQRILKVAYSSPIKIPETCVTSIGKIHHKIHVESQGTPKSQTILKKNKAGELTLEFRKRQK